MQCALGSARGNERVGLKLMENAWHAANTPSAMPVRISNEQRNIRKLYETCRHILKVSEKMLGEIPKSIAYSEEVAFRWPETLLWYV